MLSDTTWQTKSKFLTTYEARHSKAPVERAFDSLQAQRWPARPMRLATTDREIASSVLCEQI